MSEIKTMYKGKEEMKDLRFFLITMGLMSKTSGMTISQLPIVSMEMVSSKVILNRFRLENPQFDNVIILGFTEFKCKEDLETFANIKINYDKKKNQENGKG